MRPKKGIIASIVGMRLKPFILFDREVSGFLGLCEIDSYQLFVYRPGVQPSTHTTWQVTRKTWAFSPLTQRSPPVEALRRKTRPWRCWPRGFRGTRSSGGEKRNSRPLESRLHHDLGCVFVFLLFCVLFFKPSIFQVLQPSNFRCYVRRVAFDLFLDCFFF